MTNVNAAVVTSFDQPPRYQQFDLPAVGGPHQILVDVLAVGLHPRVRTDARGPQYSSSGRLPMVPGIHGVGRRDDGTLISAMSSWVALRRRVPIAAGQSMLVLGATG
jgi:NADPH:quinone reductase-like Zn-dependent oxidoreductase